MSIAQMRAKLKGAYPGADWPSKVDRMPEKQVYATYMRLMNAGKL